MPEIEVKIVISEREINLFEMLAKKLGCSIDDAIAQCVQRKLKDMDDVEEDENILFFPENQ